MLHRGGLGHFRTAFLHPFWHEEGLKGELNCKCSVCCSNLSPNPAKPTLPAEAVAQTTTAMPSYAHEEHEVQNSYDIIRPLNGPNVKLYVIDVLYVSDDPQRMDLRGPHMVQLFIVEALP